jgi:uncharacterized membrane protein
VIAVKDAKGRIKLNQLLNTTGVGAVSGTFCLNTYVYHNRLPRDRKR